MPGGCGGGGMVGPGGGPAGASCLKGTCSENTFSSGSLPQTNSAHVSAGCLCETMTGAWAACGWQRRPRLVATNLPAAC